ncbi:hypothetical protein C8Q76DRAFT_758049 [Earliella scabrosa]|nr:hypothetical protein C8Q76DRAFT_758049 [Earliella scabrosa]
MSSRQDPPDEAIHPIHPMICRLLLLFKAYYHVHGPKSTIPAMRPLMAQNVDDKYAQMVAIANAGDGIANVEDDDPARYPATAKLLESHNSFISIFLNAAFSPAVDWPENDKQPDQVDPKYRPKDDTLKRSHLHDGNFEMPSGKRPATGTHASRG